jgi:hypothetical protein
VTILDAIFHPPVPPDFSPYYRDLLATAGVLFGLAFAALLFIIQSGFASFRFSRRMFLEVYVHFGRSLLLSLAYLTLLSFSMLHLPFYPTLYTCVYCVFALLYGKAILDHYRQLGYIHTLASSAFVPASYGPTRSYFRTIANLGCAPTIGLLAVLFGLLVYPVCVSIMDDGSWAMTRKGFFYSSILVLCHAVLRVTIFIPEFFELSNQELESAREPGSSEDGGGTPVDFPTEKTALQRFLVDHRRQELDPRTPIQFLDGELTSNFFAEREGSEACFNVRITVKNPTNVQIRDQVCGYAIEFFDLLAKSQVDINQFVLSFYINIEGDPRRRSIFFRTTRSELQTVLENKDDPVKAACSFKNSLFDELFRNL